MRSLYAAPLLTVLLSTSASAQFSIVGFGCGSMMSAKNVAMALEHRGMDAALFEVRKREDCFVTTISQRDLRSMNELQQGTFLRVKFFVRFEKGAQHFAVVPNLKASNGAVSGKAT